MDQDRTNGRRIKDQEDQGQRRKGQEERTAQRRQQREEVQAATASPRRLDQENAELCRKERKRYDRAIFCQVGQMTSSGVITRETLFGVVFLGLLLHGAAVAEDPKIYKHVDETGKVTYSQTPPATGASVKKLNLQPAYRGQGGYSSSVSPYDDPGIYSQNYRQDQYKKAMAQRQEQMESARKKRLAELEAECNRNRGVDCSNPETLRYNESTKIPRGPTAIRR